MAVELLELIAAFVTLVTTFVSVSIYFFKRSKFYSDLKEYRAFKKRYRIPPNWSSSFVKSPLPSQFKKSYPTLFEIEEIIENKYLIKAFLNTTLMMNSEMCEVIDGASNYLKERNEIIEKLLAIVKNSESEFEKLIQIVNSLYICGVHEKQERGRLEEALRKNITAMKNQYWVMYSLIRELNNSEYEKFLINYNMGLKDRKNTS